LNTSMAIMITVLICVSGKLVSMVMAIILSRDQPLITVGDVVASFLRDPEHVAKEQLLELKRVSPRRNRRLRILTEMGPAFWTSTVM
jgi:hypothetical protein